MSVSFLLQSNKVLVERNYEYDELKMIYEFLIALDNMDLEDYYSNNKVETYNNDLELFIDTVNSLIKILEETEEYEKCHLLMNKRADAINIIEKNNIP